MEQPFHKFSELFAQLGLDNSAEAIDQFIRTHGPLSADTKLEDAPFWSKAQADFLRQSLSADSDWSEIVDELNTELHL
ncbi:MAG TPA: DUF2789 domain-containing protein [Gammaproteobacteria bacterium]|nr:DUF2789 domain-containing protein [Gammaproteobacteria bacterium]